MENKKENVDPKKVRKWISVLIAILSAIAGAIAGDATDFISRIINL